MSAKSRARHLVSIRGFYQFLLQEKHIEHNPAKRIDLPKTGFKLPDVLSIEDVEKALGRARTKNHLRGFVMPLCWSCFTPPEFAFPS